MPLSSLFHCFEVVTYASGFEPGWEECPKQLALLTAATQWGWGWQELLRDVTQKGPGLCSQAGADQGLWPPTDNCPPPMHRAPLETVRHTVGARK